MPIAALRGVLYAGIEVVLLDTLLAKSPAVQRPSFMAAYSMLTSLARLVGPLIGAGIATGWGIRAALAVGAGTYVAAATCFQIQMTGKNRQKAVSREW